jgi:crotonobetainyl-CoA:carnitine CoA-transferase CaiB-like acyl-CoA transferase
VSGLLDGLTVAVIGEARVLRVAARWFTDLGAHVTATPGHGLDPADDLWLGTHEPIAEGEMRVDLALVEEGSALGRLAARATVAYAGTGSMAAQAGERLDERRLAAVGGVAIAIGEPDHPPLPFPVGCLDAMIGAHVAAAGLAALLTATRETEVAGADVVAWAVATNLHLYLPYGLPWYRAGRRASGSGGCYPYALFDAADGMFCLIGRTARDWQALVAAMGHPAWADEPVFQDPQVLGRHHPDQADAHVAPWAARHARAELTDIMARHAFPAGPVLRPDEVLDVPSIGDRWRIVDSGGSSVRVPGVPFDATAVPGAASAPAPEDFLVLDLSWIWSGPAVGVGLADLGATVVKVESATRPDNTRLRGSPLVAAVPSDAPPLEVTPYFHGLNRGKRSVSIDLSTEEGRGLLRRLADRADLIVENLSPGVMARWGIAPDRVHETNPGCVFLSMPGYRDHPTTKGLRAYAPVLSSGAGIESLVAYPEEPPVGAMTFGFSDANAASQGLLLALAGLHARRARGTGSAITLSQFDAAVLANGHNLVGVQLGEEPRGLEPLADADDQVVGAERLPSSPWVSRDLFAKVRSRWLGDVSVARLPWRRDGQLPPIGDAGPELGAHTQEVLSERLRLDEDQVGAMRSAGTLK